MNEPTKGEGSVASWEETLAALVQQSGPRLHRTAYLLCGDRHAAEDLVQEAFVRALSRRRTSAELARGIEGHEAEAYLRRTVLNAYLDSYRRRRRWAGIRHLAARPASTASAAGQIEDRVDATRALATLPPQVRACMVLHYYDDLPVAQVGTELGIAGGTVKRYLSDGRAMLQAELGVGDQREGGRR